MPRSRSTFRNTLIAFWLLATLSIVLWSLIPSYVVGWDLRVYQHALQSLRVGHDPYVDGMAVQRIFHAHLAEHPNAPPPYTYVYSPITLPLLRVVNKLPVAFSAALYWTVYIVAVLAAILFGFSLGEEHERRLFAFVLPAAVFFPGLLEQDVFFSGNVAYILYGAAFAATWLGWRRNRWAPFYLIVLLASCFKAPLLSLLAIPVLSGRRQWLPTALTAVAGVALFAVQPFVWPAAFHHYLEAVELQFSFNQDFSSSPAGVLANALYYHVPYRLTSGIAYFAYAIPCALVLLFLSRQHLQGHLRLRQWAPVMLLGTILLNPRIMEYDVAPITLPMALIAWRLFAHHNTLTRTLVSVGILFAVANILAPSPWLTHPNSWRPTECLLLLGLFVAGAHSLVLQAREARTAYTVSPSQNVQVPDGVTA